MKKLFFSFPLLMMFLFPTNAIADDFLRGDCDEDGKITVGDVASLIDYLLNGFWDDEPTATIEKFTVNGVSFNMVSVNGGTFTMGATEEMIMAGARSDEYPAHQVTLESFYIGETEVTQELWVAVMGSNPSNFKGDLRCPVEQVSWNDCQLFINQLNALTGKQFRLPTEAEWEFAARGGNQTNGYVYSGNSNVNEVAWFSENAENQTHPVASKQCNELGLYDMSGNVWEWVNDIYGFYSSEDQTNPTGPDWGSDHTQRGNGWLGSALGCRVSIRAYNPPTRVANDLGFRLAL